MQLTDVMATDVVSVRPDTSVGDAAHVMVDSEVGAALVLDGSGELAGVFTERDVMRCYSERVDPQTPVGERMTHDVRTAAPATDLAEAMAVMIEGRFRHLPVVNDDGRPVGLVSMRDLMAYTSLRLRGGVPAEGDELDPAEVIAAIHRMRTGAA